MKQTIIMVSAIVMLFFVGCQEQEKAKDQEFTGKAVAAEQPKKVEPKSPFGVTVSDGKIIIDTNQTANYLQDLGKKIESGLKKIEKSLGEKNSKESNETGINMTDTTMTIDLNKTKNFMESWVKSIESVVKELNKTMGEVEKNLGK